MGGSRGTQPMETRKVTGRGEGVTVHGACMVPALPRSLDPTQVRLPEFGTILFKET